MREVRMAKMVRADEIVVGDVLVKMLDGWLRAGVVLAQRQPVESWNGEGLPPVGCECETIHRSCDSWQQIKVVAVNGGAVFGFWNAGNTPCALPVDVYQFRPILTEADKKRDEAVNEMVHIYRSGLGTTEYVFQEIYDAIAEGKIPGVKLEG